LSLGPNAFASHRTAAYLWRLEGLGARLGARTSGQLAGPRVDAFVAAWRNGGAGLGEQVLQLVILDESLAQLAALAARE
jgi:asparagine synthase (glutamine-hydrolysing)